jgi:hypothetical protein
VKRIYSLIVIFAVIGGGVWLAAHRSGAAPAAEKPAGDAPSGIKVTRDADGNVVLKVAPKTAELIGLKTAHPGAIQLKSEVKGHGQALDPAPLVGLLIELASAEAAATVSSNELARLKTLSAQGNASARVLQTSEAAALRDQLAVQSAHDRLALSWGNILEKATDLPAFTRSLTSLSAVLVRIDLPAGETLGTSPIGARVVALSGNSTDADYLGAAANVDPQTQGQGFIFLVRPRASQFLPGAALIGYVQRDGDPLNGVIIPNDAVVRTEGAGWIYVQHGDAGDFLRFKIPLDHPAKSGWFVAGRVTAADSVVVTGAQTLLSEESKGSLQSD